MVKGTTQTFRLTFHLDTPASEIARWKVSFGKTQTRCILDIDSETDASRGTFSKDTSGNTVFSFKLTEKESLSLPVGTVMIQLRLLTNTGDTIASNISQFVVTPAICSDALTI